MVDIGILEALSAAIGEADNEIGGIYQTRTTSALEAATAISATYTWNGTTTITTGDTSEVTAGDYIRLDTDGQWFLIDSIVVNTSITILNPDSLTIPSGTSQSSKAIVSLPVESTVDWPAEGQVLVGGVIYTYGSKTNSTLDDITHIFAGSTVPGLRKAHRVQSTVSDLTGARSAIDLVRRAMLVDYAEEDDLDVVGRNYGVLRLPSVQSDDVYRAIIKALAYNPRGTLLGIRLALNALIGEGNYTLYEDLIGSPNVVFITLLGSALLNAFSQGKAFLEGREARPMDSTTEVDINNALVTRGAIGEVRLKNEELVTDCRTAKPSADSITEYTGDPGTTPWTFVGSNEATEVTIEGNDEEDGFIQFTATAQVLYRHTARLLQDSFAYAEIVATINASGTAPASNPYVGLRMVDLSRDYRIVFIDDTTNYEVYFASASGLVSSNLGTYPKGEFHSFALRKRPVNSDFPILPLAGSAVIQVLIDGVVVYEAAETAASANTTEHRVEVGLLSAPASDPLFELKQIAFHARTTRDFWSIRDTDGMVGGAASTTGTRDIEASGSFVSGDVGKRIELLTSGDTNAQGGDNTGIFEIESVDASDLVTVDGFAQENAVVQSAASTRVTVPLTGQQFRYPQDLGKQIVISGSELGNDGAYTITDLLEPGTLTSLGSGASPPDAITNVAVCSGASFVTESALAWKLRPVFTEEPPPGTGLSWRMSDAGSIASTTLTLRQAMPFPGGYTPVVEILYSQVLSAQVLVDILVDNEITQTTPSLLFSYYPFYLSNPLGYIRSYLDDVTAAGVIPQYLVS